MKFELTILFPCLNEEKTILSCIQKAQKFLEDYSIKGEILIVDNGSIDNSASLALKNGARVEQVFEKGYGNALRYGIQKSKGKYIIMADCDNSYDLDNIYPFFAKLVDGIDLVVGNRFKGYIEKGAMPFSHKIGNYFLSTYANILYKTKIKDFHCGMRGFNREKISSLNLLGTGMEFASEIIIRSKQADLTMEEIVTNYYKDGREHKSHLNIFRDGMRHLICITKLKK